MDTFFSIGEVSKLHNISVQTLRHYEKKGLIKPSYVNEETGYRYYTIKQFVVIYLIRQCKTMGLSLNEIKTIIDNYTSLDSILSIITNQKNIIDDKIQELQSIRENINYLEMNIKTTLEEGIDNIFIKYHSERKFILYKNIKRYTDEFEINLSKTFSYIHEKYRTMKRILAFSISFDELNEEKELSYNNMLISIDEKGIMQEDEVIIMPEGKYLTINFDDDYNDTSLYYSKMMKFIKDNKIEVDGNFYEMYIMTRVGSDGREKSLGKVEIKIRD